MYRNKRKYLESITFLLLSVYTLLASGNKCPPAESIMPCRCRGRNEQVQVWCSHSDLERVNGALENLMRLRNMPAIDELIVENNRMPTLPARAFGALQIGRLLLRNNGLEGFSRNAFAGLEDSLEELYIVEEKLVDFPFDAIEKLRNLEAFTLEKSRVRLLPRFNGLNRLKHIRIDGSLISGFPVGAFANMASVKQIHVVNSDVATLAEGIFGRLENLVLANFSNNRIDHIQRRCFALLPRLEILSVANNNLEEALPVGRAVEDLVSLKSLDVSNNRFRSLAEGTFVNLRTLQSLNLAGNSISRVSMRAFTHLPALRKVDMSNNELKNFPKMFFDTTPLLEEIRLRNNMIGSSKEIGDMLETMRSLRYLDIAQNGLTELPTGAIRGHSHLRKLDLSNNKIARIHREAFKDVPSLTEMSLRNNSLTELPIDGLAWDIESLKELDLSMNKLTSMTANALQGLPNLARMDLSHNGIKSLGQGVFSKNKEMSLLDIADNELSVISSDAFQGLLKLTRLDLSHNHLESIPGGAFRDLKSIQELILANNRINNVPANMLSELKSLEELNLKSNSLNHIPTGFFQNLSKLRLLNLRENSISSLPNKLFGGLTSLESLKIASNQISHFDESVFDDMIQLKSLDISSNRITRLPSRSFKNLPSLERFEARENRISVVEPGILANSEGLQILDLAHNALTSVPELVKSRTLLKVIDLSHNQILKIDVDTFHKAGNLMELYLNDNKLKELQPKTFENLGSLTIVDLDGNELEEIKSGTFRNLPRLIYLRLSRNKIRNVHNVAFSGLNALDGLDLQENDLELVAETSFEKTAALKYLNLSNNNFDSMAKMGLGPLSSLEVLDMSFNRLSGVDAKSLRHLIWLVELRMNDNGICTIPTGTFDAMSRLKMLVLKNNSLAHLYESVFYKLRNNIAFIDVSGNPLSCDCEMIWLRNLMAREAIQELSDSICDGPNELHGVPLKTARPGRMVCSAGANRGLSNTILDTNCPPVAKARRKPRPHIVEIEDHPIFSNNAYPEASQNELRHNNRRKEDKLIESNDFIPGDTPTIYAGSSTSNTNTKATQEDVRKSNSVFGGLSSLFGIPLDFGLNLGISPSVSVTDKSLTRHGHVSKNGFSVDGSRKGSDPLPSNWVDRPSKSVYEPPEYVPRKPAQPYIPLNPFREQSSPPVIPSGSVDVHKAVAPNGIDEKDLHGRRKKPIVKFPTNGPSAAPPPPSWHPSYPSTETGFIPIEPFFHSNSFINRNKNAFNNNKSKNESKKADGDRESSGTNVRYFSSTTLAPRTHANFIHHHSTVTTATSSTSSSSSTSATSTSSNSAKKTGAEAGNRPFNTFNSPTDSSLTDRNTSKGKGGTSSASSSSSDSEEYNEDETSNYTPVDIQTPDQQSSKEKNKNPSDDLSLTDFWDIFTGQPIRTKNTNSNTDANASKGDRDHPHYYDDQLDSPVNFSNPIDATTYHSVIPTPDPFSTEEGKDNSNEPSITGYDNGVIRRATGKPTITKIIEQGFYSVPNGTSGSGGFTGPDNPISNELDGPVKPGDGPSPAPLIPPVVIGNKDTEPADWYYTNYHNAESGAGTEEWKKLIERSRISQLEEELVGAKRSSSRSIHSSSFYSSSSFPGYHYCLASLLYYLLVYMNP